MPQATREIKRRIRSIGNTRQITKAMELVSAAKMRRAVANVLATRTYAQLAWELVTELAYRTDPSHHPLLRTHPHVPRVAVVVVSANRGFCGGFNYQLAARVAAFAAREREQNPALAVDLVTVGRRARDSLVRQGFSVVADFPKIDVTTKLEQAQPLAELVRQGYLGSTYGRVLVAYTDFISALSQKPRLKQILPITTEADPYLGSARAPRDPLATSQWPLANAAESAARNQELGTSGYNYEYLFEPSPDEVLDDLLPRLIEVQLYQAMLESDASEHSARMLAMRNASDAAKDMIDSLTLAFNQARQAGITAELAEITAGRVAVEG